MTDLQHVLGAEIRRERRRRRRTMKWLAERAALSLVYLGEIERGKKYPSAQVLERLAWALELPLPALLQSIAGALNVETQPERQDAVANRRMVGVAARGLSEPAGHVTLMARAA